MMRNKLLMVVLAVCMLVCVLSLSACTDDAVKSNGDYTFTEVSVVPEGKKDPEVKSYLVGFGEALDGKEIVFPTEYEGLPISGIGSWGCSTLKSSTSFVVPNIDVENFTIGTYAFFECSELTSIVLPANLKSVGQWAFSYCDNLTTVNFRGTEEQWNAVAISRFGNDALSNATIVYNYVG